MPSEFQPRFGHAAEEFQRYRPGYPLELFEHILAAVPAAHRQRAIDLGAGTGKSTRALIPHFREVLAVEPDSGMAVKLKEEIAAALVLNITAENCAQHPSTADLVTIGNALHWMDASRVFANVHSWLHENGIFAIYDRPLPKATPAIDEIVLDEIRGPWKPHRDPRLKLDRHWQQQVRAMPGFRIIEETKFPYIIPMPPSDYVGFWRSTSYGSAYARTLDNPESYWSALESRFAAVAGSMIPVDISPSLMLLQKA